MIAALLVRYRCLIFGVGEEIKQILIQARGDTEYEAESTTYIDVMKAYVAESAFGLAETEARCERLLKSREWHWRWGAKFRFLEFLFKKTSQ